VASAGPLRSVDSRQKAATSDFCSANLRHTLPWWLAWSSGSHRGVVGGSEGLHPRRPMPTRRVVRRATKDYNYEDVGDDAVMNNRKRAASEAAAHVTYDEISELFGLSLAEAANRIGVRATLPSWGLREVRARGPPVLRGWHMRQSADRHCR
jgi:hypothetical protein